MSILAIQLCIWLFVDFLMRGLDFYLSSVMQGIPQNPVTIFHFFSSSGIFSPLLPSLMPVYVPIAIIAALAILNKRLTVKLARIIGPATALLAYIMFGFYWVSEGHSFFSHGWRFLIARLIICSLGVLLASLAPSLRASLEQA
jgi:hypothetical protein